MEFQDVLKDAGQNEFGQIVGKALFPYIQKEIEVFCDAGVSPEYVQKSLGWLAEIDEKRMEEICQYAAYYLQDTLEATSIGDLLAEGAQHLQTPLDVLNYMEFGSLHIEPPENSEISVLNLSGGCDWQESEGIQCLIRAGRVIYLGAWDDGSVWDEHCLDDGQYLSNYVLYKRRDELRAKAMERLKNEPVEPFCHLEIPISSPIRHFVELKLAAMEQCTPKEAWGRIESTLLFEFMKTYPQLIAESFDFLYRCFCIERDQGAADMAGYIEETCTWSLI